jgi:hypothetical protein
MEASTSGVWDLLMNTVFYSFQSLKILESADIFDNKDPYYENFHRVLTSSSRYKLELLLFYGCMN